MHAGSGPKNTQDMIEKTRINTKSNKRKNYPMYHATLSIGPPICDQTYKYKQIHRNTQIIENLYKNYLTEKNPPPILVYVIMAASVGALVVCGHTWRPVLYSATTMVLNLTGATMVLNTLNWCYNGS